MSQAKFIQDYGWADAQATPLAGDASSRRYTRLTCGERSAILMGAPVANDVDRASFSAFRRIGAHLRAMSLSAPQEIAADPDKGMLLMEDLGNESLSYLLETDPTTAQEAYALTAELLQKLTAHAPPILAEPHAVEMASMVALTFDFIPNSTALRTQTMTALADALRTHAGGPRALSLRDVHADNLMWLPERSGIARIGLLDFQDALMLPHGYDLASLVDDPRREVPAGWRADLIATYSTDQRIAALSIQRNLRILGIFHRLAAELSKPSYARYLPRTRLLLSRAAESLPTLQAPIADVLDRTAHWGTS